MITITKQKSGESDKKFKFFEGEAKSVSRPTQDEGVSMPLPSGDLSTVNQISISLGISKTLNIDFKLYKEDTDRSDGTASSQIKTFGDAITYLDETIAFPGIGVCDYEITVTDRFRTHTAVYTFESLSIDTDSEIYPKGRIKFKFKKLVV